MTSHRIRLIHWKPREAEQKVDRLRSHGFEIDVSPFTGPSDLERLRWNPPHAILIDLSHVPSHGRDVALALRGFKPTRSVPLVFVGGDPEKVERIRSLLPDATYTQWSRVVSATRRAMSNPPAAPAVPARLAGYSGTPLPKKLGIKPGSAVRLLQSPPGFNELLGVLPEGAFYTEDQGAGDLCIWFVRSEGELQQRIAEVAAGLSRGSVWIAWPKKGSKLESGLSQADVRAAGLNAGLVDYKICAIDDNWSGLLFTRRRRAVE